MRQMSMWLPRSNHLPALIFLILLAAFSAGPLGAQSSPEDAPLTLERILDSLRGHMGSARLLEIAADRCIAFTMDDEASRRIREAGGSAELVQGLRGVCYRDPARTLPSSVLRRRKVPRQPRTVAPARPDTLQSAFEAIVLSALVPGWGQFDIGRAGPGVLFFSGAVGSAIAVFYTPDVENQRTGEGEVRHPYRSIGAAAYVLLSITSAIDAHAAVNRNNKAVLARARQNAVTLQPPAVSITPSAVQVEVLRVTF